MERNQKFRVWNPRALCTGLSHNVIPYPIFFIHVMDTWEMRMRACMQDAIQSYASRLSISCDILPILG